MNKENKNRKKKKCDCWYGIAIEDFSDIYFTLKGRDKSLKILDRLSIFKYCPKCGRKL